MLEYLDISAKKFPNKVVYTDEQKEITFKQLEDYSKNIGMQIIQKTEKIKVKKEQKNQLWSFQPSKLQNISKE